MSAPLVASLARFRGLFERGGAGGAPLALVDGIYAELVALYAQSVRCYHTLSHISACLTLLDELGGEAGEGRRTIELALWWHDAIYDPRARDNEARSAALARHHLLALGEGASVAEAVDRLILLTKGHAVPAGDALGALLVSIDLSVLGAPPEAYRAYAAGIAFEYGHMAPGAFASGRAAFMEAFLREPAIFAHPALRARLESNARRNIADEIAALRAAATASPAAADGEGGREGNSAAAAESQNAAAGVAGAVLASMPGTSGGSAADAAVDDVRWRDGTFKSLPQSILPAAEGAEAGRQQRRPRILLGLTGSVACVKWAEIAMRICEKADVVIVPTAAATFFIETASAAYDPPSYARATEHLARCSGGGGGVAAASPTLGSLRMFRDDDEWRSYRSVRARDPVLHIALRNWADALVVAPLSANTLAKLAAGMSDNLLTSVARAWDFLEAAPAAGGGALSASSVASAAGAPPPQKTRGKPFLVAPAMNTSMWLHPVTAPQLATVGAWGVATISPVTKELACGDVGYGAMAEVGDIVGSVFDALSMRR